MAHLNKLAIRGIRSFDDKNIAVIEFFSPVTVIVGHNGSGKTTIIECLKYATTGDQPPNTRGGAFVHDPKMANEKEVKAQVKLRFYAANGTRMLAVRNLSVTMKKNGALTMKTLESILGLAENVEKGNGKRGVISTKCAEMDTEIPHLLGVSKAVLENVIFCHQEESYWPLSEPAALKKKFDDIFEATKYTKALNNIKDLRKERMADLKAESARLESLALEKQHADKLKKRIAEMNANIAARAAEHEELRAAYEQQVRSNQILNDTGSKFREIYVKFDQLNQRKEQYKEELNMAKENLQEIPGTDEELSERLRTHDDYIMNQRQKRKAQEAHLEDAEEQIKAARSQHVELMGRQGQLLAEEQAIDQRMADREELKHLSSSPISTTSNVVSMLRQISCRQRAGAGMKSITSSRDNCIQNSRVISRSDEPCVTACPLSSRRSLALNVKWTLREL
ncbi:AAA domain-containing protein [Daedaleopsis nitida]|nr:AAA domain-containing protein [Daedaleopsis nitida]